MASGTITGSTSNQYIDCKIVWSSTATNSSNSSKVTASLQYKRNNTGFTTYGTGSFSITINGSKTSATKTLSISEDGWVTAVSATVTVSHSSDGTKSITISATGSIPETSLSSTSCSGTAKLDTIPRASTLSYASDVTLGNICTVRWTPFSKDFYYKFKFAVGGWSLTTAAIHPNITTLYTNASYGVAMEAAKQFPNSKTAEMTVTLYTYSDKACTKQVGSASSYKCVVTIPEEEATRPEVQMELSSVNSLGSTFSSLYIQNKSRVKATFSGEGKYNATIKSYNLKVAGKNYSSPYQSDLLSNTGKVSVVGTAKDSRGFSSSVPQEIDVIPYFNPVLVPYTNENAIICRRCASDGTYASNGTYLRIKAGRKYSTVTSGGVQKNFCRLRYRYKAETATNFSSWVELSPNVCQGNLFDLSKIKQNSKISVSGRDVIVTDSYFTATGATLKELCPSVKAGVTYTIECTTTQTHSSVASNGMIALNGSPLKYVTIPLPIGGALSRYTKSKVVFTEEDLTKSVLFYGLGNSQVGVVEGNATVTWSNLMLVEGDYTSTDMPADFVDIVLGSVVPSITTSYIVQIGVIDDIGESVTMEFTIPTDHADFHLRKGGKGAAFGKYAEKENCVEIAEEWELDVQGVLSAKHIGQIDSYAYKDFDDLIYQTGYYTGASAPSAVSATNYPINETGLLEVVSAMAQNSDTLAWWGFAYQTYRTHTGLIYVRSYYSSTGWTAWKKVTLS